MRNHRWRLILVLPVVAIVSGCGVLTNQPPVLATTERGENGEVYTLDQLTEIANDPDLTDDQRREAYRDLGIEDDDLITALLTL